MKLDINTDVFQSISLDKMDKVKLMNRRDTKYWFHKDQIGEILNSVASDYNILAIDGKRKLPYTTNYFDTEESKMYLAHHNGKLNRYKIRRRKYKQSEISFLELKFKTNKGQTKKKRIPTNFENQEFSSKEKLFISENTPFGAPELQLSLANDFDRLTLVNKNFNERCTLDFSLKFSINGRVKTLDDLVIVEIKTEGKPIDSPLAKALFKRRIRSSGFSKYCVGKALVDENIKHNAFKAKLGILSKMLQPTNKNNRYKLQSLNK